LYFAGHLIFSSILDELDKAHHLSEAKEIIISGVSAGGIGVWMNVDYLAKRYPHARVTAATIAGFYFDATFYEGTNHTENGCADFRTDAWPINYDLYNAYVDQSCKEAFVSQGLHPGACMLSNNSFPYIESPSFAIQAQTDQTVLTCHDQFPDEYKMEDEEQVFMKAFAKNISVALEPLLATKSAAAAAAAPLNGAFSAACYMHGGFTHSAPLINGMSYLDAFAEFYFNATKFTDSSRYKLADDCGVMCNPTCP
jgi:hypothetical protein